MSPLVGQADGAKYDLGFNDANGNFVGLTLVKDNLGTPRYAEIYDDALSSQFFTGQTEYSNLRPKLELQLGQGDFRSGFGLEYYDTKDSKRFYSSKNVDTRVKESVVCGPLATAASLPTIYTITDGAMEAWDDVNTLTNWTKTGSNWTLTREGTTIHGGTYSAKMARFAPSGDGTIYQDAANWSTAFRDTIVVLAGWLNTDIANLARLGINDGIGTTYSSYHSGNGAWAEFVVARKIDSSGTRIRLIVDKAAYDGVVFADDLTVAAYDTHGKHWEEFDDDLFFSSGKALLRVNASTGNITLQAGMPHTITGITKYKANLYIFQGTNNYWYMTTGEVLTETDSNKQFAAVLGENMKSVVLPNTVYSATAPNSDAGWDSGTTIGSTSDDITSVKDIRGTPYVMKEDMIYYIDGSGNEQQLISSLVAERSSTSGKNTHVWNDRLYSQYGNQMLLEYDPISDTVTDISPASYITNSADFDGQIQAIASDAHWLYIIIDNGSKVELVAGRMETVGSTTSWVWHPLAQLTLAGAENAYHSAVYKRRLWVGSTDSGNSLYYYPTPALYGNVDADTDYTFQQSGELITPFMHFNLRGDDKAWIKISLTMASTTANIFWECHYQKLEDTSWTDIGDFKTSPVTEAYLPVDGNSIRPQSEMMRFKFVPKTNDTATTPVLINYDIRAIWYPPLKKIAIAQVYVDDNIILKDGWRDDTQTAATIRTALSAWISPTISWARKMYPPYWLSSSDDAWAKLQPASNAEFYTAIADENPNHAGGIVYIANLQMYIIDGLS